MMERWRVLIVDDEPLARDGVRINLADEQDFEIIGECQNGEEAVEAIREMRPDVVFLDVQMPGLDGFGVLGALDGETLPQIVFVTAYDQFALQAFEATMRLGGMGRAAERLGADRGLLKCHTQGRC